MLEFYTQTINFVDTPNSEGRISAEIDHKFDTKVRSGGVILNGFHLSFEDGKDHHWLQGSALVDNISTKGQEVKAKVTLQLQDGEDHRINYSDSSAEVLYIAECE
uniref:Uncharacterized protein n=1 Tax=Pseudobryopsis hainanensis TaxID=2320808 RepID=A0A3S5WZZ3_9CHLO|nr:hypothetical protein [Pseudobryopsis hainanensis]